MARGIIIGSLVDAGGDGIDGADVSLSSIHGADSQGILVAFDVPMAKREVGGWFKTTVSGTSRVTRSGGFFAIGFSWPTNPDNLARVAGVDVLDVKLTVIKDKLKTFWGQAIKVLDVPLMLENFKAGKFLMSGPSNQEILKKLKPEFKKAITGKEFDGIPFTMLSTDQTAILGVMPGLVM